MNTDVLLGVSRKWSGGESYLSVWFRPQAGGPDYEFFLSNEDGQRLYEALALALEDDE